MQNLSFGYFRFNSLRSRVLLIVILTGILPTLLIGSWLIFLERQSLQEQANRELMASAQYFSAQLDTYVATLLNNVQATAALPSINQPDPALREKLLQLLSQHYPAYGQIALINLDGQMEVVGKPQPLVNVSHVPSFQQALQTQRQAWVIAPALFGDDLLLHIHTPIFSADGRFTTIMGSPVPLGNLTAVLQNIDSGTAFVLDETGRVLLHPDPTVADARLDFSQWVFAENGRAPQQPGTTQYTLAGEQYIASYAPIEHLGWTVLVARPASDVLEPIAQATRQLIVWLIVTIFSGLALTIVTSGRLTRPLRDLALAAHAFGEGQPDAPLPLTQKASHEIDILVKTFSQMRTAVAEREAGLQRSETRVRALIAAMPDTLLRIDKNAQILDVKLPENSPLKQLPGDPIGANLQNFIQSLGDNAFASRIEQGLQKSQQTGERQLVEAQICLPNRTCNVEIRILPNNEQPEDTLLILRDITDQKEAQESIRKLLSALEASSEGMAILDKSQTFVYANNAYAQINGYQNPQEIIGHACTRIYNTEQHQHLANSIVPAAKTDNVWRGEFIVTRPDGSTYLQELSLNPLAAGDFVCVIRDITERKKSEEAIREAQKLDNLGLLAGGVAHDFNNLLTGILGHATIALEYSEADSRVSSQLQKVVASATKAAELTRQLLAYAGKGVFEVKPINLNTLIHENIGLLETALPNKSEILLNLDHNIASVEADSGQLQQVLMNLMINAAESFPPSGGKIRIQTHEKKLTEAEGHQLQLVGGMALEAGHYVCLSVEDNGSGIEPDKLNNIFDPFFSTKITGTGLGLSATLGIIRAHGGGIGVSSIPTQGSKFTVYFRASSQTAQEVVQKDMLKANLSGTVLVIDDQDAILSVAEDMLTARGMQVLLANNGPAGIQLFLAQKERIDLVLLDLKMPGMGGDEVFAQLKAISPEVRVIIASGYGEQELLDYFARHEDVTFLQKPYRFQSLIETVTAVLQKPTK
ncbi:MAG: PAS domain S-box protein [Chloroflexota bacterium]